jgi:hypothetical protein
MGTKWPALRSDLLFMLSDFTGYGSAISRFFYDMLSIGAGNIITYRFHNGI